MFWCLLGGWTTRGSRRVLSRIPSSPVSSKRLDWTLLHNTLKNFFFPESILCARWWCTTFTSSTGTAPCSSTTSGWEGSTPRCQRWSIWWFSGLLWTGSNSFKSLRRRRLSYFTECFFPWSHLWRSCPPTIWNRASSPMSQVHTGSGQPDRILLKPSYKSNICECTIIVSDWTFLRLHQAWSSSWIQT